MSKVIVVGSINIDMTMVTDRLPRIGETILGDTVNYFMGGKGANQAVAAARLAGDVRMVGSVGDDSFGDKALKHLKKEGVVTDQIKVEKNIFTGMAAIFSVQADNSIVVLPGANGLVEVGEDFAVLVEEGDIVLAQLEVPLATVKQAFSIAREKGARTILNPAPFDSGINEFVDLADIVTPNETEFAGMLGRDIDDSEIEAAMLEWSQAHDALLIVTRGSQGISYVHEGQVLSIPTIEADVKDTTGAGDTMNGAFAALMAQGTPLEEALRLSSIAATLSTTKVGAQTAMPYPKDLENYRKA
ncbi:MULTISPECIES: ribokinase [Aerococcus]|uniref:ribokinase n=1 Tax=Aerococcus TaxID=1375 RepID=UPI0018A702BF|nr:MULTISPECIES: ribokinase [Aerococcus]MCY3036041.1 ribokinase [Aerococcus sp. Group 2]MCY3039136.1 ribokinase [Aerococcus sp. Group 2]MCY3040712.1 ribokinase [Aerococcus sp. Group 2]MCY3042704.1 ribokinase [Aerococcus sp. Group 2]MDK6520849.1 ribokinase [Aerococcus urinae]